MYELQILPNVIGKTPRHFGVNMELQEYHDEVNLWDWLADSGSTIVREFHPEQSLRTGDVDENVWKDITSELAFDAFRKRVRANPKGDLIQWHAYHFDESVKWIGVPDGIVRKVREAGAHPLVSMGFNPRMHSQPLVNDWSVAGNPTNDEIHWPAAASAYDYYFAMIHHFATAFGVKYFLMHNEPECCSKLFHYPEELNGPYESPCYSPDAEIKRRAVDAITLQWTVMVRMARAAMDDVQALLPEDAERLFLSGPASGAWEWFWDKGGEYVDSLDFHHYHSDPEAFDRVFRRVAFRAAEQDKKVACSEFNLKPGSLAFTEIPFVLEPSLRLARIIIQAMRLSKPDDPLCEFMTLYLFNFPSTHRNHKHLLYGDMNLLDWSCRDQGLNGRGDEWYPTMEEQQVRFATPSYHLFRMLMRCIPGDGAGCDSYKIMELGEHCLIDDAHLNGYVAVEQFVVDTGERLIVNLLNMFGGNLPFDLDIKHFKDRFKTIVVRETSLNRADEVVDVMPVEGDRIVRDVSGRSLTQIILVPEDLARIESLRIVEETITPGSLKELAVYQTTRLRALGRIGDEEIDVTSLNVVWSSSVPRAVPAYQGGLVQRLRKTEGPVTIVARTMNGVEAKVEVR